MLCREPVPSIRAFVTLLWATDGPVVDGAREIVLPTGRAHLAIRSAPVALEIGGARVCGAIAGAVVGGPRAGPYRKEVAAGVGSVGAAFAPGALAALTGGGADRFAERHVPIEAVFGADVDPWVRRIRTAHSIDEQVDLLELLLVDRLRAARGPRPQVAAAVEALDAGQPLVAAMHRSGLSERQFRAMFRAEVGLPPKRFARVVRFQRALASLRGGEPLATIALAAGYADQAHLTREFRALAGIPPGELRRIGAAHPNHVPAPDRRFVQDATRAGSR